MVGQNYKEIMSDIVWRVKFAMDGIEPTKQRVKTIMQESASYFESALMEAGIKMLATVYEPAKALLSEGILTEEFTSFVTEDDMTEWVQEIAAEKDKTFTQYDDYVLEFVVREVLQMVAQDLLFKDSEIKIEE
jgi:hypothetical protein